MGSSVVVKNSYLQSNMDFMKRFVKAMVEAHVFVTSPVNKAAVVRVLAKRLSMLGYRHPRRQLSGISAPAGPQALPLR